MPELVFFRWKSSKIHLPSYRVTRIGEKFAQVRAPKKLKIHAEFDNLQFRGDICGEFDA